MEIRRVDATTGYELMTGEGYICVDVRSVQEFVQGHPQGAYNIPLLFRDEKTGAMVSNEDFLSVMEETFEKDAKLLLTCRSGNRSLRAAQMLVAIGFTDVVDLYPGWMGYRDGTPGWSQLDLPISMEAEEGRSYAEVTAAGGR